MGNGRQIVSASRDYTVRVWSGDNFQDSIELRGHRDFVFSANFSRNGRQIVSASSDRTVRVWFGDNFQDSIELRGHTNYVRSAQFGYKYTGMYPELLAR